MTVLPVRLWTVHARHSLVTIALVVAVASGAAAQVTGIKGKVTRDDNGQPVPENTVVYLFNDVGSFVGTVVTNPTGDYSFDFAAFDAGAGTYKVQTRAGFSYNGLGQRNPGNLVDEFHANVSCPGPNCVAANGTPVVVTAGSQTTVNIGLAAGGTISGTIRNSVAPNAPIDQVAVVAYLSAGGASTTRAKARATRWGPTRSAVCPRATTSSSPATSGTTSTRSTTPTATATAPARAACSPRARPWPLPRVRRR